MTGKPLNNYVVVRPAKAKEKTDSGIIIPEEVKEQSVIEGTIVAVSDAVKDKAGVVEGDRVVYGSYSKDIIKVEGEELLIMEYTELKYKYGER